MGIPIWIAGTNTSASAEADHTIFLSRPVGPIQSSTTKLNWCRLGAGEDKQLSSNHNGIDQRTNLRDYLQIIARRRWTIILTLIITTAIALGYSFVTTPVYSATASVLIPEQQAGSALDVSNPQLPQAQSLQRFLADEQNFAQGDAVTNLAQKDLKRPAHITIGSSASADLLTFTANSTNRTNTATTANAFANAYITARRANQVAQYTQQVTALQASITHLQQQISSLPSGSSQAAALLQAMQTLNQSVEQTQAAAQLSSEYGPSIVKAAKVPTSPSSPNKVRNGLLGLAAGLVLGIGLAFLFERLDDGISSREAVEEASSGLPVVALIPLVASWRTKNTSHIALLEDSRSPIAEAYRTLRTSVQFLGLDEPKRVIGITSSVPGEGKTTATANLAVSFARAGTTVAVVSGDLRRPHIHTFFGVPNTSGLTSVLVGSATLDGAILAIPGESNLSLLPSGPVPPNPAEILSLDGITRVIDELVGTYDIVLIDCPPVLPVSDALLLSRLVDGMLVLASVNLTSRTQLARTYELLRQVQTPLLGTILNCVPERTGSAYGYEYGYYGYEYPTQEPGEVSATQSSTVSVHSSRNRESNSGPDRLGTLQADEGTRDPKGDDPPVDEPSTLAVQAVSDLRPQFSHESQRSRLSDEAQPSDAESPLSATRGGLQRDDSGLDASGKDVSPKVLFHETHSGTQATKSDPASPDWSNVSVWEGELDC